MLTNHMHEYGVSGISELIKEDGSHIELVNDSVWPPQLRDGGWSAP